MKIGTEIEIGKWEISKMLNLSIEIHRTCTGQTGANSRGVFRKSEFLKIVFFFLHLCDVARLSSDEAKITYKIT